MGHVSVGPGVKECLQPGSNGPKGPISDLEAVAESCKYTIRGYVSSLKDSSIAKA